MSDVRESTIRKALATLIEAEIAKERIDAQCNAIREQQNEARKRLDAARKEARDVLKQEHGSVIYDDHLFRVKDGQVAIEKLSRNLKVIQEPLQLGSAA